jgi:hypothetical protein
MTRPDPERFVWTPDQVTVTPPPCRASCGRPGDDDQIKGLCTPCATSIDRSYEWVRDLADLEAGP